MEKKKQLRDIRIIKNILPYRHLILLVFCCNAHQCKTFSNTKLFRVQVKQIVEITNEFLTYCHRLPELTEFRGPYKNAIKIFNNCIALQICLYFC